MNVEETLATIQGQLRQLSVQTYEIEDDKRGLLDSLRKARVSILRARKILSTGPWSVLVTAGALYLLRDRPKAEILRGIANESLDQLRDLFEFSYHDGVVIEDGIEIRVDDNDVSIVFAENRLVTRFVRDWEITVSRSHVRQYAEEAARSAEELSKLADAIDFLIHPITVP